MSTQSFSRRNHSSTARLQRAYPRTRWAMLWLLFPLAILFCMGWSSAPAGSAAAHHTPRLTSEEIARRSLTLCASFSDTARLVQEPLFHEDWSCGRLRAIWDCVCEADGKRYWLKFNDTTGVLAGMAPEQSLIVNLASESAAAPLETPTAAANVGLSHLREMGLVPSGTRVTLKTTPTTVNRGRGWKVTWQARSSNAAPPYDIRMVLARRGGTPVMVLNGSELASR